MKRSGNSQGCQFTFGAGVPEAIKRELPSDDEVTCQMCGACPGDTDGYTGKHVRFCVDWVPNNGLSSRGHSPEVRVICSTCASGRRDLPAERPSAIQLLSQIRRAGNQEQQTVYEWLHKKFGQT